MKTALKLALVLAIIFSIIPVTPFMKNEAKAADIEIGDYVMLGKYNSVPILWRCVDIDENGPLMVSDRILCTRAYDADGMHKIGKIEKMGASSLWEISNIRCWLNSSEDAGEVEYLCGNPPSQKNLPYSSKYYSEEKGFLAEGNFSEQERGMIKTVEQKSIISEHYKDVAIGGNVNLTLATDIESVMQNYDTAYYQNVTDKVFLLDIKQLLKIYQNRDILGEDYHLAKPTEQWVLQSGCLHPKFNYHYWLRTPYGEYTNNVLFIMLDGEIDADGADNDYSGIRPAFYMQNTDGIFQYGDGSITAPFSIDESRVAESDEFVIVEVNGNRVSFDTPPFKENNRILVPMRAIFEEMGASVQWEEATKTIIAKKNNTSIKLQIDKQVAYKNNDIIHLDVAPKIVGGRTMVPVRFISESMGATVQWDEKYQCVDIRFQ